MEGWVGVSMGYVGVVVLLTKGQFDGFGHFDPLGVALALTSTLLWAWYWIMTVRLDIHPVALMLNGFAVATGLLFIICWTTTGVPTFSLENIAYGACLGLWRPASPSCCGSGPWRSRLKPEGSAYSSSLHRCSRWS